MQKKTKVLHLLNMNRFSGAENMVCQIISMFKDDAFDMVYCSPDGPIRDALEERHINFFPVKAMNYSEAERAIREIQPDIIHAHDVRASIIASGFARKARLISHIHGNHENMRGLSLKSILYRLASRKYEKIIWVSSSSLEQYKFKSVVAKKSLVLQNIINIESLYQRLNEDQSNYSYDIIFLGRLSYEKDPFRLIDIIELVAQGYKSVKVVVVGDGNLMNEVKSYAEQKGLSGNIDFLGYISNPYKVLACSKVFVMTSRYEGTPMSALESMALGLPVISTPTDGLIELVIEGKTGFLSDNNQELANRILILLRDENRRIEMSEQAKEKAVEINNIEAYKSRLKQVYMRQDISKLEEIR